MQEKRLAGWVIQIANIIQTIPALAMLAVLMLIMGLGTNTVVLSLFLYSLLPILKTPTRALETLMERF